jgi:hypothetical protein
MLGMLDVVALVVGVIIGFAVLGLRRKWLIALPIWIALAGYTAWGLLSPLPPGFDEQDRMGHDAWALILVVLMAIAAFSFALGLATTRLRARSKPKRSKEVTE